MANQSKFEAMLEKLIAEDKAGAEELFHEIVVEKSRSIYEGLIEDDVKDVEVDEASKSEDEKVDEKEANADDEAVDEAGQVMQELLAGRDREMARIQEVAGVR